MKRKMVYCILALLTLPSVLLGCEFSRRVKENDIAGTLVNSAFEQDSKREGKKYDRTKDFELEKNSGTLQDNFFDNEEDRQKYETKKHDTTDKKDSNKDKKKKKGLFDDFFKIDDEKQSKSK